GFYALIEWKGRKSWTFPLMVVGANSITAYIMSWTMESFFLEALERHLGTAFFGAFGPEYERLLKGFAVMLIFWSILLWMYRRKIFLRI
ncbi:MAG: DUF5009 domain-containing protein, partial [Bryobacteraceae bacterium]|nr:DUF5009 domain-containing protein [Bryobacteraceae bacterium]